MTLSREHTFKGVRTNTTGEQLRKHHTQMTKFEKQKCADLLTEAVNQMGLTASYHLKKRGTVIDYMNIIQTLTLDSLAEEIIEYNERKINNLWTQRILFNIPVPIKFHCERINESVDGYLKVVYCITTGEIITAYYNTVDDNHRTLREEFYDRKLIIRNRVQGGYVFENARCK